MDDILMNHLPGWFNLLLSFPGKIPPKELQSAEQKLEESFQMADESTFNLLSGGVEQVTKLQSFVESQLEYHRQSIGGRWF